MRIHLVTRDHTSDHILSRLARVLLTDQAFSVGTTPDARADLNLFFPYLERAEHMAFTGTKTAAWFTHLDSDRKEKVDVWNATAARVDLRLTCVPQYAEMLSQHGMTELVTPTLDRERFVIGKRAKREQYVIGTSGFVYPGGRKGEHLIKRLADEHPHLSFVASGQGWPVKTTLHNWDSMPVFYQGLDVYVCTSTIEGIGYGPLEAMACGVPVVIPRGVGVFDGLPDLENLHRYKAGDYDDLKRALNVALSRLAENGYNPTSLRGATARFTNEAWIDTTLQGIEKLLFDRQPVIHNEPWHGKSGVFYVAYGEPARECAVRAIASFKKYMPTGVEVALVSDTPLNAGEDVFIQHDDEDIGGRSVKTQIWDLAPANWQYILYLDADTEVVADISFLFQLLEDGWSWVMSTNPAKYVLSAEMRRPDNQEECDETFRVMGSDQMLQLNGGVFCFRRNEATMNLLHTWHQEWKRYGKRDQAAFNRALFKYPLRIYVLGNEWNTITRYLDASRTAGILHYPMQARRWRGVINGRLDSSEAWGAIHPTTPVKVAK